MYKNTLQVQLCILLENYTELFSIMQLDQSQHLFLLQTTASSNNVIKVTGQVKLTVTDQPRGAPAGAATTLANGTTTMTAAVTPSSLLAQPTATAEVIQEKPVTIIAAEVAEKPNKSSLKGSREKVLDDAEYVRKEDQFTCFDCVTDGFARIWSSWFD